VDDAARLLLSAAEHATPACPVVNGASGLRLTVREVLAELFRVYGSPLTLKFTGMPRPGDPIGYLADVAASKDWGWQASVDWREGIARYVRWFKGRLP
jgi:UDP-glucose 4-epimerase